MRNLGVNMRNLGVDMRNPSVEWENWGKIGCEAGVNMPNSGKRVTDKKTRTVKNKGCFRKLCSYLTK